MKINCWCRTVLFVSALLIPGLLLGEFQTASADLQELGRQIEQVPDSYFEIARLLADDAGVQDHLGQSVAVSEDTFIAGALIFDNGPNNPLYATGAAYVFGRDVGGLSNWGFLTKIVASDAQKYDYFGVEMSLSGDTLAVSASFEDGGPGDPFQEAGAVYIFERDEGGLENWGEVVKLTSDTPASDEYYGFSLDIDGDTLVILCYTASGTELFIYERDLGGLENWGLSKKYDSAAFADLDNFDSVALNGDTLVIGDGNEDGGPGDPLPDAGVVLVLERDLGGPENWGLSEVLRASDADKQDHFGWQVGVDGDTIVVGAQGEDGGPGDPVPNQGSAYVFERDLGGPENWGEAAQINPSLTQSGGNFGSSVAIDGDWIVAGAANQAGGPNQDKGYSGAAYLFGRNQGGPNDWGLVMRLIPADEAVNNRFGSAVDIKGENIGIGAVTHDGDPADPNLDQGAGYVWSKLNLPLQVYLPVVRECAILYQDDYSDSSSGWPVGDSGSTLLEYRNGAYRVLLRDDFISTGALPGVRFFEYLATVDLWNATNKAGTYGIAFGAASDWTGFYTFEIDSNQHYELWRYNGAWALMGQGNSSALHPGTVSNTIAVERDGDNIAVYANGQWIKSMTNNLFTGNLYLGVWVTGDQDQNLDVRFDNFKVEPLGCGWSNATINALLPVSGEAQSSGGTWALPEQLPRKP